MNSPAARASGIPLARHVRASVQARTELALRLLAFVVLATFATLHWMAIVVPTPSGRGLLVVLIAAGFGAALAASAQLPRSAGIPLRMALVVVALVLALVATGIRLKLLLPGGWGTLSDRLTGGLSVVGSVGEWPYSGPNTWLRLTTLSAAPLATTLAAAFAFWPLRPGTRRASTARFTALVLLLVLYGTAVAARPFGHQGVRGLGLLAAIAAWLWLPRLRGRDAAAAAVTLVATGVIALGLTAKLASDSPWVDYRHWQWTLHKSHSETFDWRQTYGPIHWSRTGKTLLLIKSKKPHYWRAQVLNRFDGVRWTTDQAPDIPPSARDIAAPQHPGWSVTATVTLRGLRSQLVIGPGTLEGRPNVDQETTPLADATYLVDDQLKPGDTYTVRGYVPDPTVHQMRRAPVPDQALVPYTSLTLPLRRDRGAALVVVPLRGVPGSGTPNAMRTIEASRYADVYRLARNVTRGARTEYDKVARIAQYLEGGFTYDEHPPAHRYPLEAFLFKDKVGYCQQFSGAAALMLRMLGIPTRVASGFAPGTYNKDTHEWVVRDLDAHAWIEVWFEGIGWVPFDPTPPVAPAGSQSVAFATAPALHGALHKLRRDLGTATGGPEVAVGAPHGAAGHDSGPAWGVIALLAALAMLALSALVGAVRHRRRRHRVPFTPCGDPEVDHLVLLLARLGLACEPGTTLLVLEERLGRLGGPEAAAYARTLRERRFGANGHAAPGRAEKRKLRRQLAAAVEAGPLTRLQLALPEARSRWPRARKLVLPQRSH
jgi:transglutaminase-like putative cysteine protease